MALYRQFNLVYRDIWGASYPQDQILEDLETAPLLHLQAETGQLRYLISQLPADLISDEGPQSPLVQIEHAIMDMRKRYSEYLEGAFHLVFPGNEHQRRFVMNLRCIVPLFLGVVLCLQRVTNLSDLLNDDQREAIQDIMQLVCKTLIDEGETSMARIAWPLFVTALESDDLVYQSWILERFNCLQTRGENYRRAREAIVVALEERKRTGRVVGVAQLLRREEIDKFVI